MRRRPSLAASSSPARRASGSGASHISDCIAFVERIVLPHRPQRIVFYAGDNDIAHGKSAERVLADWQRFAKSVLDRLPDARIVFLAIKPSPERWEFWPEARRANALIQAHCASDRRLRFVDVATPMLGPNGLPRPELYAGDRLHLSEAGYKLWVSLLGPVLLHSSAAPTGGLHDSPVTADLHCARRLLCAVLCR